MSLAIQEGSRVTLLLEIQDGRGQALETATIDEPFVYYHGAGEVPPGVERALEGLRVGSEFDLVLAPEDAFGAHDPGQVIPIPRSDLPEDLEVAVGDWLPVLLEPEEGEEGEAEEIELPVVAVDGDAVTVDLNHPFAGQRLRFLGRVLEVEEGGDEPEE
jgi:FKBP-type peptidyl-prolyl cis-trans isomerase SlyD